MNRLQAAFEYAARGLPVFPLNGKKPLTEHGLKDASVDTSTIRAWWKNWPEANIGIPTGRSSRLWVLDVDPRHGGNESLAALEAKHGSLPPTLEGRTGGGGRHLFFAVAVADAEAIRNSAGKLAAGLDVRGEGGYVVVPPSLHPDTNTEYTWANEMKPALAPLWVLQLVSVGLEANERGSGTQIPEGQRNATLTSLAGAMRRRGSSVEAIEAALLAENAWRCEPRLSENEVRSIARSVSRYAPGPPSATPQAAKPGFKLSTLREMFNEPEEKITWLLGDKLPAGGISVLSAKPKVGKSTLARCLALAVARGDSFLGCETTKGPVIYLALEEKRSEVRHHFASLGANGEEPIHIHCAAAPKDATPELCKVVAELKPILVIIDPLFKFVRVADEKAYAEVCQAIEPLLTLARETAAHVMLVHHSGKAERADATDAILGSTAIFGGVDAALILKRTDRYRTLQSSQRYGTDWAETVLEFDPAMRALSLGAEKSEVEAGRISQQILDYLSRSEEARTREEIEAQVEGDTGPKRKALRLLVEQRKVGREGTGKRGDPFRYRFLFACLEHIEKASKQEIAMASETPENTGDILVCRPAERQKPFEEGEL